MLDNIPECSSRRGEEGAFTTFTHCFPTTEVAVDVLSPTQNSEQLMGFPSSPLPWIIPITPWAPLLH